MVDKARQADIEITDETIKFGAEFLQNSGRLLRNQPAWAIEELVQDLLQELERVSQRQTAAQQVVE